MNDEKESGLPSQPHLSSWDYSSDERFYNYYAEESQSEKARERFSSICNLILRMIGTDKAAARPLEVAEIGCGAGTMSIMWAEMGHHAHGLDINKPLLELGKKRAAEAGYKIDFQVGSAVELPWADESMDVCIALGLLEHVADWETCLKEFTRILRKGGILCLMTTNKLCPIQEEYNLPLYSWYPPFLKHYFERLAMTKRPDLVNFTRYPAVNWFSFYSLRKVLTAQGFRCFDRFDVIDTSKKGTLTKWLVASIRTIPILRWLAHTATSSTIVVAIKGLN
ncbi:MAG TPA: class I SAM-dependent methyltransferase [Candidatus Limnocylindrales bacterium]|nr:class I SAM-dependent methyltransferase [Candidatus Limnocylindrales bacterium]